MWVCCVSGWRVVVVCVCGVGVVSHFLLWCFFCRHRLKSIQFFLFCLFPYSLGGGVGFVCVFCYVGGVC